MRLFPLFTASSVALILGCGSTPPRTNTTATPPPPAASVTPPTAQAQIVSSDDDPGGTASEVFARARMYMEAGKLALARTLFDRVVLADKAEVGATAPSSMGRAAAYNAALCSEQLGDTRDARDRFKKLADLAPGTPDALDADLRRARLDVELEDWDDLALASTRLLAHADIGKTDRGEALALQALTLIQKNDLASADKAVASALKLIEPQGDVPPPPQNAAAVHFAHGDAIRARGLLITFVPVPADFGAKMEARCQSILDAEEAYVDAIKTKDTRWAVRAGLRVASMYIALHDDLVVIPPPKSASTDAKKALFRGAMRLRYRILLEKGLGTLEHTLNLETSANAKTTWLDHVRKAKATLEKQLADEKAEIAKLPYTEAQLQKALDDLASKPATKS